MKTSSPHQVYLRAGRIDFLLHNFLCVSCWDVRCHASPCRNVHLMTLFRNHKPNCVPEMSLLPQLFSKHANVLPFREI